MTVPRFPRLCSSRLLRLENPCCPDLSGFPDFVPRHIYKYAYVTKSMQLHVTLRFSAPRYPARAGHNLGLFKVAENQISAYCRFN